jgi:hypothetical protein
MYNQDVAELFSKVQVGTKVRIINEVEASEVEQAEEELL